MRASTWEELGEHPAEHYVVDEPFRNGDLVMVASGEVAVVEGCDRHDGFAARMDGPGESPWWEVSVRFGDGRRDSVDADELSDFCQDEADDAPTAGQNQGGSDV